MPSKLDRVRSLLNFAADPGAEQEEARTAAVTAARLIKREGFVVEIKKPGLSPIEEVLDELTRAGPHRRWPEAGPSPRGRSPAKKKAPTTDHILTAKAAGFCSECGDAYPKGARVVWQAKERRIVHRECHSARRGEPTES